MVGLSASAGCIGPLSKSREDREPFSHPSTNNLMNQPALGPEPSRDVPVVIAFEDVACPVCARFHNNTFQSIKDYTDSGDLTFIYRGIDVVYNWGSVAAKVQEAVHQNRENRTFDVIDTYFDRQGEFSSSNELDKSSELLRDLDIDNPDDIIKQVNDGEFDEEVSNDLSASEKSGVRGTPTFDLLTDGKHKTKLVGAKNIETFENVLDL